MAGVQLHLPRVERVVLHNFSLYDNAPEITADIPPGVFCLAGANGLGKSTFLAAVNFAMTGVVAPPDQRFQSTGEWTRDSLAYSRTYFRGRIRPEDEDTAEIELMLRVGEHHYTLTRGVFEPQALRSLRIDSNDGAAPEGQPAREEIDALTDAERHGLYAERLRGDIGLDSFEQFIFLQHFVLTFDERRQLVFWDERIAQQALFLTFGLDLERQRLAEDLIRRAERADSQSRNLQWQATQIRRKMKDLEDANGEVDDALVEQHQALLRERKRLRGELANVEKQVADVEVTVSDFRASEMTARAEYEALFSTHVAQLHDPSYHPVVEGTMSTGRCAVCGTEDPSVTARIGEALEARHCPLCDTDLSDRNAQDDDPATVDRLRELDAAIGDILKDIRAQKESRDRLTEHAAGLHNRLDAVSAQLADLEAENDKRAALKRRDDARRELRDLQRELARGYAAAEEDFVPRFARLAHDFLGLDLQIDLEMGTGGVGLLLTVQGTKRREVDDLSESQRFFLDIALRMALAQQLSAEGSLATLYVDTPEGSLDVAYEARAGTMFARFVQDGFSILMTANINTSQLLLRLAQECGEDRMTLLRMTEWTSLTEVQADEEPLFEGAYSAIEEALRVGEPA
jgi:DNA repair exonuclease SbcCD ATPase subunit